MKKKRQEMILKIISSQTVETQEELLEILAQAGFTTTQATISRDIRELSLMKELVDGSYRYRVAIRKPEPVKQLSPLFLESIISVVAAQNIVVVKTIPGMAMAICTALDKMDIFGNVGTLAGDDTCFLVMADNETAESFTDEMEHYLG